MKSTRGNASMRKGILVIIVLAALAAAGIVLIQSQSDDTNNTGLTREVIDDSNIGFTGIDKASLNGPYSALLSTNSDPNGDITASAEVDARGNVKTIIREQTSENTFIYVDGTTYIQLPDESWIKFGGSGDATQISSKDISIGFNEDDVQGLSDLERTEVSDCTLGSCNVFNGRRITTNEQVTLSVDTVTNRISDIVLRAESGKETTITYSYDKAIETIQPPEEFREFFTSGTEGAEGAEGE